MVSRIDLAQAKWARKTIAKFDKMARNIKDPEAYEKYCKELADFGEVSVSEVKEGAGKGWKDFQDHFEDYRPIMEKRIREAAEKGKWKEGFRKGIVGK